MIKKDLDRIPDKKKCLELMDTYNMLPHIRDHSLMVCEIALSIAKELNETGEHLNLAEIEAASLLHDITKTKSLETGENHAETGAQLLKKLGFTRIADIIQEHIIPKNSEGSISEEEVVCYADKRVVHDRIVGLDERFEYLKKRYGSNVTALELIDAMEGKIKALEKKILVKLNSKVFDISSFLHKTLR